MTPSCSSFTRTYRAFCHLLSEPTLAFPYLVLQEGAGWRALPSPTPGLGLIGPTAPSCSRAWLPSSQSWLTETQKNVWNSLRGEPPASLPGLVAAGPSQ